MSNKFFYYSFVLILTSGIFVTFLQAAYIFPLEIFTNNGDYSDGSDINLHLEVSDGPENFVNFTLHNVLDESMINPSIASIYFDSEVLLSFVEINSSSGTLFSQNATPRNLPAGRSLDSPFLTSEGLSFDSAAPPPKNGINPGEWVRITLELNNETTFEELIDSLNTADVRIGAHIIALPDGSSESAITIPEPIALSILALGSLGLRRKRKI